MVAAYPHCYITPVLQPTTQEPYQTDKDVFCFYISNRKIFQRIEDVV